MNVYVHRYIDNENFMSVIHQLVYNIEFLAEGQFFKIPFLPFFGNVQLREFACEFVVFFVTLRFNG